MPRGAHPVRAEERHVVRGDRAVGSGRGEGAAGASASCRSGWPSPGRLAELCEDGGEAARWRHWLVVVAEWWLRST